MKPNDKITTYFRTFLGLFLVFYALNQFFHFFPTSYGSMPELARQFLDSVALFLPYLYAFELIIGLMLIFNIWSPLILIVLIPLSVSFLFFTIVNNDMREMWPALVVALLNMLLIISNRDKYLTLLH